MKSSWLSDPAPGQADGRLPWPVTATLVALLGLPPAFAGPRAPAAALPHVPAASQPDVQTLVIGRVSQNSVLTDTAERVMRMAFGRIGVQVEFRPFPMLRSLQLASEGSVDGDLMRIADVANRFPNLIPLSTPISRIDVGVFTTDPTLAQLPRTEQARLRIGLTRGIIALSKYTQGLRVTEGHSIPNTLEMLRAGRFDIAVETYVDAMNTVLTTPAFSDVIVSPQCWASEPLYFYLHRRHIALLPGLNRALRAMQREGVIERAMAEALQAAGVPLLDCSRAPGRGVALPDAPSR